mmetsp:Transcript_38946/g.85617  ORF Transcript_38946/g.85617 Transcript_38946/m.85617 type:complete len:224 (-) Transcript_38946:572-1243(-)
MTTRPPRQRAHSSWRGVRLLLESLRRPSAALCRRLLLIVVVVVVDVVVVVARVAFCTPRGALRSLDRSFSRLSADPRCGDGSHPREPLCAEAGCAVLLTQVEHRDGDRLAHVLPASRIVLELRAARRRGRRRDGKLLVCRYLHGLQLVDDLAGIVVALESEAERQVSLLEDAHARRALFRGARAAVLVVHAALGEFATVEVEPEAVRRNELRVEHRLNLPFEW